MSSGMKDIDFLFWQKGMAGNEDYDYAISISSQTWYT